MTASAALLRSELDAAYRAVSRDDSARRLWRLRSAPRNASGRDQRAPLWLDACSSRMA